MPLIIGNQSVGIGYRSLGTNAISLNAGETFIVPQGAWSLFSGKYTSLQQFDPVTGTWRPVPGFPGTTEVLNSDGINFRIANQSGCAVGALLTNAGSGYVTPPIVTASAGASVWTAIVGGAVSTAVTVVTGGTNYLYPPIVLISAPASPGIQASAYCTLTSGAVSSVTIVDQGAGYTNIPTISFLNDPRDTTGSGASAALTLTGANTVTGVVTNDHGNPQTAVPTLTFTGGGGSSAAATAIMNFAVTAYAVTTGGTGYSGNVLVTAMNGFPSTASAYTNPSTQVNLVRSRNAQIQAAVSAGAIVAAGQVLLDGGLYPGVPAFLTQYNTPPTAAAALTLTVGGLPDVSILTPA